MENLKVSQRGKLFHGAFTAMASPCEILVETNNQKLAQKLLNSVATEAFRIEHKFSRYRTDNIVYKINQAKGQTIQVDEETAKLLDFAHNCYLLSDGLFDISSGILRQVWHFDGGSKIPKQKDIKPLLALIGWGKITWEKPFLTLLPNMEIDFGGIAKEYAVDKAALLVKEITSSPVLINFGGDLYATGPQKNNKPWLTGIENRQKKQNHQTIELLQGALATSGDAYRYLELNGQRYSHILNPKTGWPEAHTPAAITVLAENCIEAGIMSTLAMLQGSNAQQFLDAQAAKFKYWITSV